MLITKCVRVVIIRHITDRARINPADIMRLNVGGEHYENNFIDLIKVNLTGLFT